MVVTEPTHHRRELVCVNQIDSPVNQIVVGQGHILYSDRASSWWWMMQCSVESLGNSGSPLTSD